MQACNEQLVGLIAPPEGVCKHSRRDLLLHAGGPAPRSLVPCSVSWCRTGTDGELHQLKSSSISASTSNQKTVVTVTDTI